MGEDTARSGISIIFHEHSSSILTWVAITDYGRAVGSVSLTFEKERVIKLHGAHVSTEFRGQGIYSKLYDERMDYIMSNYNGYKLISWCKESTLGKFTKKGWREVEKCTLVEKYI